MEKKLNDQEQYRRESLEKLKDMGIDCYPAETFSRNATVQKIQKEFDNEPDKFQRVRFAGRIMTRRIMGKASFVVLEEEKGKIQAYFNRDEICPGEDKSLYNDIFKKYLDIGDIIGVIGFVFRTKVGELSIHVKEFTILSKALKPLPVPKEKDGKTFYAFSDQEQRYRQRYLDLIVNAESRKVFKIRSDIYQSMRKVMNSKGYLEVETPILQPIYGGAAARPFKTHHNTLDMPLYLRIANELYLKRLIVGGYDGVYEFAKDFRNEGMSRFHNPEFTQMELYVAYKDYNWMMDFVEILLETIVKDIFGTTTIQYGKHQINFSRSWKRYSMFEAIQHFTGEDIDGLNEEELKEKAKSLDVAIEDNWDKGKIIDEIFGTHVEPNLIQPTFITDYPIEMSPLAKKHRSKEGLVERFEGVCIGKEICNAFSELNDPIDQRKRFEEQLKLAKRGDEEAMVMDEDYITALEYGMPPTAGLGIGIDRLTMILTNSNSIQDVLFFPQMKPKKEEKNNQKED